MGSKSSMLSVLWVAVVGLLLVSGCRSTDVDAGVYGSDNLYGDPLIADIPLNDLEGLPTDGDRSMFAPV